MALTTKQSSWTRFIDFSAFSSGPIQDFLDSFSRACLKSLYWTQTEAYEAVKRSAQGSFMPFDGAKCPTEPLSNYFLDRSLEGLPNVQTADTEVQYRPEARP